MALLAFQKPDSVSMLESTPTHGKFEFKPLEPGYGMTIGNALRRILLSSPEGYAINSIKIDGVQHEFASIPGVLEDVTNIILNLKKVRLKHVNDAAEEETVTISVSGKNGGELLAGDLTKNSSSFSVLNKDLVICHLDKSASFNLQITIDKGRGWIPAEEIAETFADPMQIAIDAIYTPITNVKINVENTRVGQKTDYDKLLLEIDTDGSMSPVSALKEAAAILIQHFQLFNDDTIEMDVPEVEAEDETLDKDTLRIRQLLKTKLDEVDLSVRAQNCLSSADVHTVADLVKYNKSDLLKFRNFGRKSLTEIEELLDRLGLTFGMDVSKYKLDND
ncbi:MAG: DNA-directed RNA polymerase subunit alpha [Bacteroidales bacterium]|nr:DNA-directed RNA polymerase subunit alpha [Bacteroidales bacterium]